MKLRLRVGEWFLVVVGAPVSKPHIAVPVRMKDGRQLPQAQTMQTAANHTGSTQNNHSLRNPLRRFNDTQNFSCRKFRLVNFSSNQPARQPTSTTTNVRSATTSSPDRKFRLMANAASRGASLSFCDGISWGSVAIDADMKVIVSRSSLSSPGSASSQQQRQAQSLARSSERIHKAMIVASGW